MWSERDLMRFSLFKLITPFIVFFALVACVHTPKAKEGPAKFVQNLMDDKKITIAVLGTSLSEKGRGWPEVMMSEWLEAEYPGQVTLLNYGMGGSASSAGDRPTGFENIPAVIRGNPDVVFIEFATNDAYLPYKIRLKNRNTIYAQ